MAVKKNVCKAVRSSHLESAFHALDLPLVALQKGSCNSHVGRLPAMQRPLISSRCSGGGGG